MKIPIISIFLLGCSLLAAEDWTNTFNLALQSKQGNTNLQSYNAGFASVKKGDIRLGPILLQDSEFSLTLTQSRGSQEETLYEHKGAASFLFDLAAHQTFSPFSLFSWEYDSLAGLESRTNMGLGAKYRFTKGFSFSFAALWESQNYIKVAPTTQMRLSLRPKYKRTFENGTSIVWILFYQPYASDPSNYLVKQTLTLALTTGINWLSIAFAVSDDFNSMPPEGIKKNDADVTLGFVVTL